MSATQRIRSRRTACILIAMACCTGALAKSTLLDGKSLEVDVLRGDQVRMQGRSELYINGTGQPLQRCTIELNSEDAWVFLHGVRPSEAVNSVLKQIKVNGKSASIGKNVRVVQYGQGAVIIPHPRDYQPLEVFSARSYTGKSSRLEQYREYDSDELGDMNAVISSFILKRGYMVTFAENEDGTGHSRCYVAQDNDLEVAALPAELDNCITFVRIFPWRWVSKKGSCDIGPETLNAQWHYNWNIGRKSTLDWEYVAIKQQPHWPGLDRDWPELGVNHLLGYNEPNNRVEDAYKNLQPHGSVDNAVERWPELLKTGLRLGSPAVTDGGRAWILDFMKKAKEKNYRVDFVAIHYYRSYWKKDDPEGAARQLYGFLEDIHNQTGKPIWLTEWNNGANWTDSNHDPSPSQQKRAIKAMVRMLDETPWLERYAIYSNVEDFRKVQLDGKLTGAGEVYAQQASPIGHRQEMPPAAIRADAVFLFDHDFLDVSGSGNNARAHGSVTFSKLGSGSCISFDGETTYLQVPTRPANLFDGESAFSFAGWVRWGGGESRQRIFDFCNAEGNGIRLSPNDGSGLKFSVMRDGEEKSLIVKAMKPGVWTHLAATVSDEKAKLYVNGECVCEAPSVTIDSSDLTTSLNYIGRGHDGDLPFFKGEMYEARFLAEELGAQQIQGLAEKVALSFADKKLKYRVSAGMNLHGSLTGSAEGGSGKLSYSRSAGPEWLTVHPDGRLEGQPEDSDKGENVFIVMVQDEGGRIAAKRMIVDVR